MLSTERINRQKAVEAMQSAYSFIEEEKPEFVVCDSPYTALKIVNTAQHHLGRRIEKKLRKPLQEQLESQLTRELIQIYIHDYDPIELYLKDSQRITLMNN